GSFPEGEAGLVAAVRDPRSAEIHPSGDGGAGAEDKPEPSDRLHIRKQVNQGDQTHQAADRGAAEAKTPFLVAGTDGRHRHHEAGDHGGVDAWIVEADEEKVASKSCERALDREMDI